MQHAGEMVKAVIRAKGMTQTELARRIGKNQTLISRFLSGKVGISTEAARSIAEVLGMDFEELRHQIRRDKFERRKEHIKTEFKEVIDPAEKDDIPSSRETVHVGSVGILDAVTVPILDFIPIGGQISSKEDSDLYVLPPNIQVDTEKAFAIKVSGEDMTDDKVDEGDIIVVDPETEACDAGRILVILNGKPALRNVYRMGESIMFLSSDNREEPAVFPVKGGDFEIVGRVVMCVKFFR
jgi:SOS-response transcriptional repressor LexA